MAVLLNRKTFEAALPHMPMATVMAMVAADVAGHPPLHERAEGSVGGRLHDQVEMIRHEADAEERDGVFGFRRGEQVETCGVVPVLVEDHGAAVATIQHMHGRRVRLLVREESEAWDAYGTRNGSREARKSSLSPFPPPAPFSSPVELQRCLSNFLAQPLLRQAPSEWNDGITGQNRRRKTFCHAL